MKKENKINKIFLVVFGEFSEFVKSMTWKKLLLSILGMVLLGTSVALIYSTNMGMSAWDAVSVNIIENTVLEFRHVNPIIALSLMTLAHLILWKKPNIMFFFPLLVSFLIGAVIDVEVLFMPVVANLNIGFNILYLVIASFLVGFGLNLMIYIDFPLPAIDQFCKAIATRFHLTFGQGKYAGEIFAMVFAVILGLIYSTWDHYFYLGFTTIYYILALGYVVDLVRNPLYRFLGIQTVDLFDDDLTEDDVKNNEVIMTSRAILMNKGKILLLHYLDEDFYLIPGGTREKGESRERCARRELLEETGYKVKVNEERLIIRSFHPTRTFENHYFLTKLRKDKIYTEKIQLTDEERKAGIEMLWIEPVKAIELLSSHETASGKGMYLMNREFIALINLF